MHTYTEDIQHSDKTILMTLAGGRKGFYDQFYRFDAVQHAVL